MYLNMSLFWRMGNISRNRVTQAAMFLLCSLFFSWWHSLWHNSIICLFINVHLNSLCNILVLSSICWYSSVRILLESHHLRLWLDCHSQTSFTIWFADKHLKFGMDHSISGARNICNFWWLQFHQEICLSFKDQKYHPFLASNTHIGLLTSSNHLCLQSAIYPISVYSCLTNMPGISIKSGQK